MNDFHNTPTGSTQITVYHGTNSDFESFDISYAGTNRDSGFFGKGIYFSPEIRLARKYGSKIHETIITGKFLEIDGNLLISRKFTFEALPDCINRDEFQTKYSETLREKIKVKTAQQQEANQKHPWGGAGIQIPNEDEIDEEIISELLTKHILKAGYVGVKGFNPISGLSEYVIFSTGNIVSSRLIESSRVRVSKIINS